MTREDAFITANYGKMTSPQIAAALGAEWNGPRVRVRAQKLGISIPRENTKALSRRQSITTRAGKPAPRKPRVAKSVEPLALPVPPRKRGRETPQERSIRWSLEAYIGGPKIGNQVKCVCGKPGAPVHCAKHKQLLIQRGAA